MTFRLPNPLHQCSKNLYSGCGQHVCVCARPVCCCRNPVKFWFIKNYMSPQMKRFVPEMAAHYNFHYQFVTYKWPSFLHKQVSTENRMLCSSSCVYPVQFVALNLGFRFSLHCQAGWRHRGSPQINCTGVLGFVGLAIGDPYLHQNA